MMNHAGRRRTGVISLLVVLAASCVPAADAPQPSEPEVSSAEEAEDERTLEERIAEMKKKLGGGRVSLQDMYMKGEELADLKEEVKRRHEDNDEVQQELSDLLEMDEMDKADEARAMALLYMVRKLHIVQCRTLLTEHIDWQPRYPVVLPPSFPAARALAEIPDGVRLLVAIVVTEETTSSRWKAAIRGLHHAEKQHAPVMMLLSSLAISTPGQNYEVPSPYENMYIMSSKYILEFLRLKLAMHELMQLQHGSIERHRRSVGRYEE